MTTFRKCTTDRDEAKRGFRPGTAVNDQVGKTQHLAENSADVVAHVVFFGAAGKGDDRQIRDLGFSDLRRREEGLLRIMHKKPLIVAMRALLH